MEIKRLTILGVGSIGSNTALKFIEKQPIEEIQIFDGDYIKEHNLYNTPYTRDDVGKNKALTLKKYISNNYPNIRVEAEPIFINDNKHPIKNTDLIIDTRDVSAFYRKSNKIFLNGSDLYIDARKIKSNLPKKIVNETHYSVQYDRKSLNNFLDVYLNNLSQIQDNFVIIDDTFKINKIEYSQATIDLLKSSKYKNQFSYIASSCELDKFLKQKLIRYSIYVFYKGTIQYQENIKYSDLEKIITILDNIIQKNYQFFRGRLITLKLLPGGDLMLYPETYAC
ncbi:MAG: hypothetical protein KatS3mg002_0249 [Candidatus Woesearchaeota archaeon]|nr:MAG: hypothetical protein KatS3mg002_0249 [Candidatus Woesearchaeota archaeon]